MIYLNSIWNIFLVTLLAGGCRATEQTITVSSTTSHPIPTTLWGQTFEDVNSADGALFGDVIRNRAFQKVTPNTPEALDGWHSVNGAQISVVADPVPLTSALPNAIEVKFPSGRFGPVGFGNEGFHGGQAVDTSKTYSGSFWYRFPNATSFKGNAAVGFQRVDGLSLGTTSVAIDGSQTTWKQVVVSFKAVQATTNNNNYISIVLDGVAAAGQTIHFTLISFFPPLLASSMRPDVQTALTSMAPGFFRFPGGKNLGTNINARWQWNNTVGSTTTRPGRIGSYGYVNTDALGLFEFLNLAQQMGATPIMGIWAGYALDGSSVADEDLGPYLQQAIDQINFAIGPTTTAPGHPVAFPLTYIEIGSEEFFSSDTYMERWRVFTTVLSQNFPQLKYIATSNTNNPVLAPDPTHWDVHSFNTPGWFAQNSFFYDSFERNGTMYLEGEYAAVSTDDNSTRLLYPTMESAASEAAFMTGIERNSDIVFGASYSPLLNNIHLTQSSPSLLSVDATKVYFSTSWYVQQMFSTNRGTVFVPSTLPNPNGSIFWSITRNAQNQYVFKISNIAGTAENVIFILPISIRTGTSIVLTGGPNDSNTPATPSQVVPVTSAISLPAATPTFTYVAPPFSVNVVRMS